MSKTSVETFKPAHLEDALVLVAFPTAGSASSIAGHYLVRHLDLPLVGHLRVPEMSAIAAIQDGIATSAIRIFGGEVACKLDKGCPHIYVVMTELAPPPVVAMQMTEAVLDWAAKGGAHLVLALEAVVRNEGDDTPDVYCASADAKVLKELAKAGLQSMQRALIGGTTAHLLLLAAAKKVRSGTILVEALREMPDGRAAAALISALDKMLPDVDVDPKPLMAEAMKLEAEISKLQENANVAPIPAPNQFI